MTETLASEWIKLRTVRAHQVMLALAAAFPLVLVALTTSLTGSPRTFGSTGFVELVVGLSIVTVLVLGVVAVISLAAEYSHGTIRPTYAATPSRARVVVAKWLVNSATFGAIAMIVVAVSWLLGAGVLAGRDAGVELSWADGTLGSMVSLVVLAVEVSWFGLGIALVVRSAAVGVTLILIWPLLIENLLSGVAFLIGWRDAGRWMPFQSALMAVGPDPEANAIGRPVAFVWFGAVSLGLLVLGLALERRRDA